MRNIFLIKECLYRKVKRLSLYRVKNRDSKAHDRKDKLAAMLSGSRLGVQSASLIMTSLMTS